jgi:hypothetical protein
VWNEPGSDKAGSYPKQELEDKRARVAVLLPRREVIWLKKKYKRPVICTEFMARSVGSTFDRILPIAKEEKVGAIN